MANEIEKKVIAGARDLLDRNTMTIKKGGRTFRFTCPDVKMYPAQWLWDSCFHIIARRWIDIEFARDELVSLLSGQWENGMIPNMVHIRSLHWRISHYTGRDTSGITQPPLVADAAMAIFDIDGDRAFLESVYPNLRAYYKWLLDDRDDDRDSLISVFHPWETGIDNSCRWDTIFGEDPAKFKRWKFNIPKTMLIFRFNFAGYTSKKMKKVTFFDVEAVDMNCYLYKNLTTMSNIAAVLGLDSHAAEYDKMAAGVKSSVLGKMWNEADGAFYDLEGDSERQLKALTPFSLLPLYAGLVDQPTADRLISHIENPDKFWTPYPIPTVEKGNPGFNPIQYWRGTTWININWLLVQGLKRYGREDLAAEIIARTLKMVERSGFREYYNPLNGDGHGARNFGWSSLVIDMINSKKPI